MAERNLLKQILEETRIIWDRPSTRAAVRKNFAAVLDCGTPALGWKLYASQNEERRCYHRCRSRFCSSCGYRATLLWLEEQAAALPDIPYHGIVFTMPRKLWGILRRNRHLVHDLPVLGAAVLKQWARMKCGTTPLILVVPHTFGGDLKFNTHLHILMSDGGFHTAGSWIPDLSLNKTAIMRMWRYAVVSHLRRALAVGILKSELNVRELNRVVSDAYENKTRDYWIIHLDKIVSKTHFLKYAARYVRRPPIAKWRILRVTGGEVEYVAKDTRRGVQASAKCTLDQFVRLLAAHVPDNYRHVIRYFGILAPRSRGLLYPAMFLLLRQERRPCPQRLSWRASLVKYFGIDPMIDGFGQEMHWVR